MSHLYNVLSHIVFILILIEIKFNKIIIIYALFFFNKS